MSDNSADPTAISGGQEPENNKKHIFSRIYNNSTILFKKTPLWGKIAALSVVLGVIIGLIFFIRYQDQKMAEYNQAVDNTLNIDTYYQGISVAGIDLSGKTKEEAYQILEPVQNNFREKIDIKILYKDSDIKLTENNLNFNYNTSKVLEEAYNFGREGNRHNRYKAVLDLKEHPKNFELKHDLILDDGALDKFAGEVAGTINVEMKPPFVSEFHPDADNKFVFHEGITGVKLNSDVLKTKLDSKLKTKDYTGSVEAETEEIPVQGNINDLAWQTGLITEYTTVSTNNSNANNNMSLALKSINGKIIGNNEIFSFNGCTGDTTTSTNGYLPAGAISKGKLVQEYGGGICQSATTVYGAAMRANMNIISRYNHLWTSDYVPIGQDATVSYSDTDFSFQNTSGYTVFIAANMTGKTLRVKIYGYKPPEWDSIDVVTEKTATIPQPEAQYITDNSLAPGQEVVDKRGYSGAKSAGSKIYYKDGQVVKTEPIASSYYPAGASVIRRGPGSAPAQATPQQNPPESSAPAPAPTPAPAPAPEPQPSSDTPSSQP